MIKLPQSLQAWGKPGFNTVLKNEIQAIKPSLLPLQAGLSLSSYVGNSPFSVVILHVTSEPGYIRVKTGIFYSGIIAGCSCSDDPSPVDEQTEYCQLQFLINTLSAETDILLLDD